MLPSVLEKKVTGVYKESTLEHILSDLSTRYKIDFFYIAENIPLKHKQSLVFESLSLQEVLLKILDPINIGHMVVDENIVLVPESPVLEDRPTLPENTPALKDSIIIKHIPGVQAKKLSIYTYSALKKRSSYSYYPWKMRKASKPLEEEHELWKDSVIVQRRKLTKLRKHYINQWQNKKGFAVDLFFQPEFARWRMKHNKNMGFRIEDYNSYERVNVGFSLQSTINYHYKRLNFIGGFGFYNLERAGTHTDYYINYLNPMVRHAVISNYAATYHYGGYKLGLGYQLSKGLMQVIVSAAYEGHFLIGKAGQNFYPYYRDKYYLFGPPYSDGMFNPLIAQEIEMNKYLSAFSQDVQTIIFISETVDILTGIHFRQYLSSIYSSESPVIESPVVFGLRIGVRYNFR
ncbi:MAG: hypothetical protein ACK4ND_01545 [Cytophagaceae bacterium]